MKKIFIILISVLLLHITVNNSFSLPGDESLATDAAFNFLSLIDRGEVEKAFDSTSAIYKKLEVRKSWIRHIATERELYGHLVNRAIKKIDERSSVPSYPDGKYIIIQYETSFINKKTAYEVVYLVLEKDNQWKVANYFCK